MRIAFIAMSGVRVHDAELMRIGLTLPGFVERSEVVASLPRLGLLTLAGMTPRDRHEVSYHEVRDLGEAPADLAAFDLVAISTFTAQADEAYALAARCRAAGAKVVIGGLHATAAPDEVAQHADAVVVGEGEVVWPQVLDDAARGQLQQRYDARGREFDLADAPMPAFDPLDLDKYNRLTVQVTRGCPWRCSFCASSILLTPKYKHKPIDKVLAEVDRIRTLWPRPFLELADDNSIRHRPYWLELLPRLAERRVKWFTETDISLGDDPELLALLRDSGCAEVLVGLESPDTQGLAGLEQRADWKLRQAPRYAELVRNIQAHGIRVNACFILGLDGHDAGVFDRVRALVADARPFDVQITLPTPLPGTALYRQLQHEGRLLEDRPWRRCTLFDVTFRPTPMSADELRAGFIALARDLYSEDATRRRRAAFRRQVETGAPARHGARPAVRPPLAPRERVAGPPAG